MSCSSGGMGVVGISLTLSCMYTHRMTLACACMDGTQVLWDTDLSPCFLIFQALQGTGSQPSLSEGLSQL